MSTDSLYKRLFIDKIIDETPLAKTIYLKPDSWNIEYESGQFITLVFQTAFGEKRRSYSISSSPVTDNFFSITVKRQENGEFSRFIIEHVKEGDALISSGISGFFKLPEKDDVEEYNFFAAGSGITPCYSMIKTLLRDGNKKVNLIYSNRSENDTIFYRELIHLMEMHSGRFKIVFLFSGEGKNPRRLSQLNIPEMLNRISNSGTVEKLYYLCGPFEYMRMIRITLLTLGIDETQIRKENFNDFPVSKILAPPDLSLHDVTVHIGNSVHVLKVKFPDSIIVTAKMNKINLPYSCEAGRCGSCVARCTSGKIWMSYNEVLTEKDVNEGLVLTCQGFPIGGDAEIYFS